MADASERETLLSNRSSQVIVVTFLLLAFILLNSTNQIEETSPLIWKNRVSYDSLFYRDEVPEEYREYIQFSARVINRTFPYVEETGSSEDTYWVVSGLKDVLALERLDPSDDNISRYYLYSEAFGLYDIPRRLNESINGITMSDLLLADYVEVSGYSFLVSSGPTTLHRIFCILDLEALILEPDSLVDYKKEEYGESTKKIKGVDTEILVLNDYIDPEIALSHGFKGYVNVSYVSEMPARVIVSPGKILMYTIRLELIPHISEFKETRVVLDPKNSSGFGVGWGDPVPIFNDYISYSPDGTIFISVDKPCNVTMILSVPEGLPGMSAYPRHLLGIGIKADVPVVHEMG